MPEGDSRFMGPNYNGPGFHAVQTHAIFSATSYGEDIKIPDNWNLIEESPIAWDFLYGFHSKVYRDAETNHLIFAFRGTVFPFPGIKGAYKNTMSAYNGVRIVLADNSPVNPQLAVKFVDEVISKYPGATFSTTGHSQGAPWATYVGLEKKCVTMVFENPGLDSASVLKYGADNPGWVNIYTFQSTPNFINQRNKADLGHVYHIPPNQGLATSEASYYERLDGIFFDEPLAGLIPGMLKPIKSHSMLGILRSLDELGQQAGAPAHGASSRFDFGQRFSGGTLPPTTRGFRAADPWSFTEKMGKGNNPFSDYSSQYGFQNDGPTFTDSGQFQYHRWGRYAGRYALYPPVVLDQTTMPLMPVAGVGSTNTFQSNSFDRIAAQGVPESFLNSYRQPTLGESIKSKLNGVKVMAGPNKIVVTIPITGPVTAAIAATLLAGSIWLGHAREKKYKHVNKLLQHSYGDAFHTKCNIEKIGVRINALNDINDAALKIQQINEIINAIDKEIGDISGERVKNAKDRKANMDSSGKKLVSKDTRTKAKNKFDEYINLFDNNVRDLLRTKTHLEAYRELESSNPAGCLDKLQGVSQGDQGAASLRFAAYLNLDKEADAQYQVQYMAEKDKSAAYQQLSERATATEVQQLLNEYNIKVDALSGADSISAENFDALHAKLDAILSKPIDQAQKSFFLLRKARLYHSQKNSQEAIKFYEQAQAEAAKVNEKAGSNAANGQEFNELDLEEAIPSIFEEAISELADLYLFDLEDADAAIKQLQQLVAINPVHQDKLSHVEKIKKVSEIFNEIKQIYGESNSRLSLDKLNQIAERCVEANELMPDHHAVKDQARYLVEEFKSRGKHGNAIKFLQKIPGKEAWIADVRVNQLSRMLEPFERKFFELIDQHLRNDWVESDRAKGVLQFMSTVHRMHPKAFHIGAAMLVYHLQNNPVEFSAWKKESLAMFRVDTENLMNPNNIVPGIFFANAVWAAADYSGAADYFLPQHRKDIDELMGLSMQGAMLVGSPAFGASMLFKPYISEGYNHFWLRGAHAESLTDCAGHDVAQGAFSTLAALALINPPAAAVYLAAHASYMGVKYAWGTYDLEAEMGMRANAIFHAQSGHLAEAIERYDMLGNSSSKYNRERDFMIAIDANAILPNITITANGVSSPIEPEIAAVLIYSHVVNLKMQIEKPEMINHYINYLSQLKNAAKTNWAKMLTQQLYAAAMANFGFKNSAHQQNHMAVKHAIAHREEVSNNATLLNYYVTDWVKSGLNAVFSDEDSEYFTTLFHGINKRLDTMASHVRDEYLNATRFSSGMIAQGFAHHLNTAMTMRRWGKMRVEEIDYEFFMIKVLNYIFGEWSSVSSDFRCNNQAEAFAILMLIQHDSKNAWLRSMASVLHQWFVSPEQNLHQSNIQAVASATELNLPSEVTELDELWRIVEELPKPDMRLSSALPVVVHSFMKLLAGQDLTAHEVDDVTNTFIIERHGSQAGEPEFNYYFHPTQLVEQSLVEQYLQALLAYRVFSHNITAPNALAENYWLPLLDAMQLRGFMPPIQSFSLNQYVANAFDISDEQANTLTSLYNNSAAEKLILLERLSKMSSEVDTQGLGDVLRVWGEMVRSSYLGLHFDVDQVYQELAEQANQSRAFQFLKPHLRMGLPPRQAYLHEAISKGWRHVVKLLCDYGVSLEQVPDVSHPTPLYAAIREYKKTRKAKNDTRAIVEIEKTLVSYGANSSEVVASKGQPKADGSIRPKTLKDYLIEQIHRRELGLRDLSKIKAIDAPSSAHLAKPGNNESTSFLHAVINTIKPTFSFAQFWHLIHHFAIEQRVRLVVSQTASIKRFLHDTYHFREPHLNYVFLPATESESWRALYLPANSHLPVSVLYVDKKDIVDLSPYESLIGRDIESVAPSMPLYTNEVVMWMVRVIQEKFSLPRQMLYEPHIAVAKNYRNILRQGVNITHAYINSGLAPDTCPSGVEGVDSSIIRANSQVFFRLHCAVIAGDLDILGLLLDMTPAAINAVNHQGNSLLDLANKIVDSQQRKQVISLLIERGATQCQQPSNLIYQMIDQLRFDFSAQTYANLLWFSDHHQLTLAEDIQTPPEFSQRYDENIIEADRYSTPEVGHAPSTHFMHYSVGAAEITYHPRTKQRIFTYRAVDENNRTSGTARFYSYPMLCRSEDATRHNVMEANGVFSDFDIDPSQVDDVCAALPPTRWEEIVDSAKHASVQGLLRGMSNVVAYAFKDRVEPWFLQKLLSESVFYSFYFISRMALHAFDEGFDNALDIVIASSLETAWLCGISMALGLFSLCLECLSWFLDDYGYSEAAKCTLGSAKALPYGSFFYQAHVDGAATAVSSVAAGALTSAVVEAGGKAMVDYLRP